MDECKLLPASEHATAVIIMCAESMEWMKLGGNALSCFPFFTLPCPVSRGLHSFTFQLNLSALYGIGGTRSPC